MGPGGSFLGPGGNFHFRAETLSWLGFVESFLWDKVVLRCTLDDSPEDIDEFETPWSMLSPESQLDFYGDVRIFFSIINMFPLESVSSLESVLMLRGMSIVLPLELALAFE